MVAPTGQIKSFDNLRNILRGARHESGVDLYQHLVEVMNHIIMHNPDNGLDQFEEISYLLKHKNSVDMNEFIRVIEKYDYNSPSFDQTLLTQNFIQNAKKFFSVNLL